MSETNHGKHEMDKVHNPKENPFVTKLRKKRRKMTFELFMPEDFKEALREIDVKEQECPEVKQLKALLGEESIGCARRIEEQCMHFGEMKLYSDACADLNLFDICSMLFDGRESPLSDLQGLNKTVSKASERIDAHFIRSTVWPAYHEEICKLLGELTNGKMAKKMATAYYSVFGLQHFPKEVVNKLYTVRREDYREWLQTFYRSLGVYIFVNFFEKNDLLALFDGRLRNFFQSTHDNRDGQFVPCVGRATQIPLGVNMDFNEQIASYLELTNLTGISYEPRGTIEVVADMQQWYCCPRVSQEEVFYKNIDSSYQKNPHNVVYYGNLNKKMWYIHFRHGASYKPGMLQNYGIAVGPKVTPLDGFTCQKDSFVTKIRHIGEWFLYEMQNLFGKK